MSMKRNRKPTNTALNHDLPAYAYITRKDDHGAHWLQALRDIDDFKPAIGNDVMLVGVYKLVGVKAVQAVTKVETVMTTGLDKENA